MQNLKLQVSFPFWILTLSVVFGLTLPILIQDGMFQDAMLYCSVAHNLGIGIGTFWFPQYSTLNLEGIPSFHEQPPLVFGIQGLCYSIFGDSLYIERAYTFLMIILHIVLINMLWKEVFRNKVQYQKFGWLPVLFWILIPVCFWSYRNNMIENTVSVFTMCSIIISYRLIQSEKRNILLWLLSGLFIFLASFSKGVPGFFPITFPVIYWLVTRQVGFKKSLFYTFLLISVPFFLYAIFIMIPDSKHSLSIYFYDRLIRRINLMPTAAYRLEIVWRLFTELLPVLIFACITVMIPKKSTRREYLSENRNLFFLFLAIGLSGSLPLTLTMVQKGWYLVPSFPFFAIAFAVLIIPIISNLVERIDMQSPKFQRFVSITACLFLAVMAFTYLQKDKISREHATMTDVYQIGKVVPKFSTMTVPLEMYDQYDFILQGFLVRYFNISISPYQQYDYFLKEKKTNHHVPSNYEKVDLALTKYELYKNVTLEKSPQ
jgi:4-amino-4-deoxy-L-arabinose transferase-like glycosyltransferase